MVAFKYLRIKQNYAKHVYERHASTEAILEEIYYFCLHGLTLVYL
jgi:hypothetical protein